MQFGMNEVTAQRVDDLTSALERQADSNDRLARAIEGQVAAMGGVLPVKPAPAQCCEHGDACTRTRP